MQRTSLGQEQRMCQKALILSNSFVQGMLLKSFLCLFSLDIHIFIIFFKQYSLSLYCAFWTRKSTGSNLVLYNGHSYK